MQYAGRKLSRWMVAAMLFAAFFARPCVPAARAAQVLYDDFNDPSNLVRSDLWQASEHFTGNVTESLRFIDRLIFPTADPNNGKLFIGRRLVVLPGASGGLDRVLYNAKPAGITGVQVDVTMSLCIVSDGTVQARVIYAGFGNGTISTGPGDQTGDILGILQIDCKAANQPEISWLVVQCSDFACNSPVTLQSGVLGSASIGQRHTLHVQRVDVTYVFTADGLTQTVHPFVIFGPNFRLLQIGTHMDFTTPANGGEFAVVATFDNVLVDK